ncbi:transglutaminase family protein [Fulvimarina sp. MAC8]|uniref:transglutaminase family protein n=1 Tax=Fulvimarina sp. MAC8 TaxID=3162874 RepID=UPI0032EEF8B1
MKYDITLKIDYQYAGSVADARHALRVRPRLLPAQTPMSVDVKIKPQPEELRIETDFFGNERDAVAIWRTHHSFEVEMRARISVHRDPLEPESTEPLEDVVRRANAETRTNGASPVWYLGQSRRIEPYQPLTAYIREILGSFEQPAAKAILDVTKAIKEDFTYKPGATDVGTSVPSAFDARIGVCQDFAHVMIAGLRANGIPAGYVSGFLRTDPPPGQPRLEGADAMHAWVTAWLGPETGWVDFDPTNGIFASNDHIVVAIGRDYDDVTPISGVLMTTGPQETGHTVDVIPVEAD